LKNSNSTENILTTICLTKELITKKSLRRFQTKTFLSANSNRWLFYQFANVTTRSIIRINTSMLIRMWEAFGKLLVKKSTKLKTDLSIFNNKMDNWETLINNKELIKLSFDNNLIYKLNWSEMIEVSVNYIHFWNYKHLRMSYLD
jgi:hypothetical protein